MTEIPNQIINQNMKREEIDLNEDTFANDEALAEKLANDRLHEQMNQDNRIPSSLQNRGANPGSYDQDNFSKVDQQRPVRDRPLDNKNFQNSNLTGKKPDLNFGNRKQIDLEADDTFTNQDELSNILARGERLKKQMSDALDPSTSAWEQLHGQFNVPKSYIPPFMKDEHDEMLQESPEKIRDKMYDIEVENKASNPFDETLNPVQPAKPQGNINLDQQQNLEDLPEDQANKRQIADMKFIRVKIKTLRITSESLLHNLIDKNFTLNVEIPLPDFYSKQVNNQSISLNNYDVLSFNEFAFNSLSLYNFRVDEKSLGHYVGSEMGFLIADFDVFGVLPMNKLIMASDFKLEANIDLNQKITKMVEIKRGVMQKEESVEHVGTITVEINLQSGDSEDEMRRNYQIKMQRLEEERAKQEAEKIEQARKKMQFIMEEAPVFGQIYLHIEKLGHSDNIGERTKDQVLIAETAAKDEQRDNILVVQDEANASTLNNRVSGTDEEAIKISTDLERASKESPKINLPKRNLYVQFKAFPNFEALKTNTVWQQDDEALFGYRSQFPVLMSPDTLDKMERFIFVLELWDQISPSVQEFLGLVKIPLAPICYSMKTTDQEIYSLNFMADQFCMYPMIVSDGFLPIYSPKLGQNIGHLKVTLAMGSPVQVNRLIQKEQEEERRIAAEVERKKIWEAEQKREKEIKEQKRIKKEKKRQLEEERKQREADKEEKMDTSMLSNKMSKTQLQQLQKMQRGGSPAKMDMAAMMRMSMNSDIKPDYDQRNQTMINCLRKLFEEARTQNIEELNGESLFKDEVKNFDGTVQKDEVVYALLNSQNFSLTRIEVSQIMSLMLDINRDDKGQIDIDELHFSFRSYIKYYELIEQRIIDLLEKFKISIIKKLELQDIVLEVVAEIEQKCEDSKMPGIQLREILEDRHGIQIRDALYDQFMLFFDLDRDQQVYTTSLCEYLKNTSSQKINFYKVNSGVITQQISDYIKNSVETQEDCLTKIEEEFKQEIFKNKPQDPNAREITVIPADLLIKEKINAKLFQFKLKRMGIALSLWEVFTLFEHLNTKNAKMFFEPQRYHHIMFGNFYQFIKNEEYNRTAANVNKERRIKAAKDKAEKERKERSKSRNEPETYDLQENGYRYGKNDGFSEEESVQDSAQEGGYWHKNEHDDTEDPRKPYKQIKHIFEIKVKELKNIPVLNKFISQTNRDNSLSHDPKSDKIARAQANKYIQNVAVKYSFPLDEDEILESDYLQLNKDALDQQGIYNYNVSMDTVHTYIIGKEDNIKRVFELCQNRGGNSADPDIDGNMMNSNQARREELFNMSIALYQDNREYIIGNSHLPIEDLIDTILQFEQKNGTYDRKAKKSSLNRTLFLYGTTYSQRENCIIGKLQIELSYTQEKLFLSKKEAMIYQEELKKQEKEPELSANPYSCFMHRETYINRKIPLNAKLSVLIDRVSSLKESIENIEHFAKIQHSAMGIDFNAQDGFEYENLLSQKLSSSTMVQNRQNMQHLDRRRVLKHILKNGLNLIVRCSVFEEDQELSKKYEIPGQEPEGQFNQAMLLNNYSKYQTRMLYNSLNPVFGEVFEMNLQMDTKIFEYLKNKRAIFEVRHYIIESQKQKVTKMRESYDLNQRDFDEESQKTIEDEDAIENCDYIVLGYVRVPLLQLITKNNGVDGEFAIFDEFKQKMGSLKMRITLNHHNSQRPLYSTSTKLPHQVENNNVNSNMKKTLIDKSIGLNTQISLGTITKAQVQDSKVILGLDFIELILKERRDLVKHVQGQTQRFYLKFRCFNQNYQTKFIGGDDRQSLDPLNILLQKIKLQKFDIKKTTFIELDLIDQTQIESAFGKPLEIQLWHKIESLKTYEKPIKEEMLGQFFIELNELSKITNRRIKDHQVAAQPGKFQVYEGYFSLHESKRDILSSDRLGMRLFLFNKDDTNEMLTVDDMNTIFNQYRGKIEEIIASKLDQAGKGYTDQDDLIQIVKDQIPDEYLAQKLIWFIKTSLEFKSVDKVFYSPLFGLPPPFFKYAKKFDQLEIVMKLNQELESLDSTDNGFIPVNLFRNALEEELKIKTKIIDDFINSIRDIYIENSNNKSTTNTVKEMQSLDVNLITNSLKSSHIDYIVLLRKLSTFMEQNNNAKSFTHQRIIESVKEHEAAKSVTLFFEIDNGMRIKNPLNPNEKPNTFVSMKPTFKCKEEGQFVQTSQIKSNSYPNWNFKSQNFTMPINKFNEEWLEEGGNLEFEVFHKAVGASDNLNVKESNHLIGVAFVSLKPLVEGNGKTRITGLFEVVNKDTIYRQSVQSLTSIKDDASHGKIKICVTSSLNIRKIIEGGSNETYAQTAAYNNVYNNDQHLVSQSLGQAISFGQEYKYNAYPSQKYQSPQKSAMSEHLEVGVLDSHSFQKHDQDARAYHSSLQNASEMQIDDLHKMNMSDLDELTKKLKDSMAVLDVTEPSFVVEEQKSPKKFGMTTFKTDNQQANLSTQLEDFRKNPFASINEAQPAPIVDDDLTRVEEPPKVESGRFGQPLQSQPAEEEFDEEEMKRIEKILKKQ